MRAFISIELPERIRKEIFKEFEKMKNSGLVSGNFVKKENLHLTLKFFGNISEEEIEKIKSKISELSFSKFELFTDGVGVFPSEKYVKILWTKLISNKLKFIKDIIEEKLFEIGINKETREFSSHVTVARVKNVTDRTKFLEKVKTMQIKKMSFEVEKISLLKSELTRNGPIYKVLEEFKLTN